ncbi:hypothetical protein QQF64_006533 [Cirrhinus molitorella]|uniref:Uncharacterized protein n=1 Tax=Cirrhinus molitorella TaxID=172907 RepID=A0ABR3M816_9TELE
MKVLKGCDVLSDVECMRRQWLISALTAAVSVYCGLVWSAGVRQGTGRARGMSYQSNSSRSLDDWHSARDQTGARMFGVGGSYG